MRRLMACEYDMLQRYAQARNTERKFPSISHTLKLIRDMGIRAYFDFKGEEMFMLNFPHGHELHVKGTAAEPGYYDITKSRLHALVLAYNMANKMKRYERATLSHQG